MNKVDPANQSHSLVEALTSVMLQPWRVAVAACSVRALPILLLLAIAGLGCNKTSSSPKAPASSPKAPEAVVPVNVQIDKVYLERLGGNAPANTEYKIISNLKNNGSGLVSVDGSCSWTCPGSSLADAGSPQSFKARELQVSWEQGAQSVSGTPICAGAIASVPFSCTYHVQGLDAARKPVGPPKTLTWQGTLALPK
jgi:hypothetical protein